MKDLVSKVANFVVPQVEGLRESRKEGVSALDCLKYAPGETLFAGFSARCQATYNCGRINSYLPSLYLQP
jgi:hypothetical protein